MESCVSEFMDNILARVGNGPDLSENELLKLIGDVDFKMEDIQQKISEVESEMAAKECLGNPDGCEADALVMHCFLNNVVQAIEKNAGREDYILTELISFCNRNFIAFPPFAVEDWDMVQSRVSLNTCADVSEEHTRNLWQKIHSKLKNGLVKLLKALTPDNAKRSKSHHLNPTFYANQRIRLFELLCCLYSVSDVWNFYCRMRQEQLDRLKEKLLFADYVSLERIEQLKQLISKHIAMINEDIELVLLIDKKETHYMSNLIDCYTKNAAYHIKIFLSCYEVGETRDTPIDNTAILFRKTIPEFSDESLRIFAKVFVIFDKWTSCLNKLIEAFLSSSCENKMDGVSLVGDEEMEQSQHHFWNWQLEFEPFVEDLKQVFPSYIHFLFDAARKKSGESNSIRNKDYLNVSSKLIDHHASYPLKVTQKCGKLILSLSEVIIFIKFSQSEVFKSVSEVGVYSLVEEFNAYISHMEKDVKVLSGFDLNCDYIYDMICDTAFIENQLNVWETFYGDMANICGPFHFVRKSIKSLQEVCVNNVIKYHLEVVKSSIVYDAHGNNWEEDKYFYEGERCSFTVQMWNFYIRGVIHDLFACLPPVLAKRVVHDICLEMLIFFSARYTSVKVVYRKVKQLKADILVLLKSFSWLLLFLVAKPSEFFVLNNEKFELWHKLCTYLLQTLVVVCCPLSVVQEYIQNADKTTSGNVEWYNYIGTNKYQCGGPILLVLEILMKQPIADLHLFSKFLALKYAKVPVLILKNIKCFREPVQPPLHFTDNSKGNKLFVEDLCRRSQPLQKDVFLEKVYYILLRISPTSFLHFMASLIEEDNSKSFKASCVEQIPDWLELLSKDVNTVLKRILHPAVDLLVHDDMVNSVPKFSFTALQKLPCGCPTAPEIDEKKFSSDSLLLHKCLIITLSMLVDNISCIPSVIWDIFVYIKDRPNVTASWTKQAQLGTKILACLLFNWLTGKENIQNFTNSCKIEEGTYKKIKDFAELLWHVVYNLTYEVTDNAKISMDIYKDMQSSSELVLEKLSVLNDHCNRDAYKSNDILIDEDILNSSTLPNMWVETEKGTECMQYLRDVITLNKKIIRDLLLGKSISSTCDRFIPAIRKDSFDPVEMFQYIGDEILNHSDILNAEFDWNSMIRLVPFSKVKVLIGNRFEFQESSVGILREDEVNAVSQLKHLLDIKI